MSNDFLTDKVFTVMSINGSRNLSISRCKNRMIIRYLDEHYEHQFNQPILYTCSHLQNNKVDILLIGQTSVQQLNFMIETSTIIKIKFDSLPKSFVFVGEPHIVLYPKINISGDMFYDMEKSEFLTDSLPIISCCSNELYGITRRNQLYIFDFLSRKNLNCIIMRKEFKCCLYYEQTTQIYLLFVVYDDLSVEIISLRKTQSEMFKSVVIISREIIENQQKAVFQQTDYKLLDIYVQQQVALPEELFFNIIIKTEIQDKCRLFAKILIKYSDIGGYRIVNQLMQLYLNIPKSNIYSSNNSEFNLFSVGSRGYLTRNIRQCQKIFEFLEWEIEDAVFQRDKLIMLLKSEKQLKCIVYDVKSQTVVSETLISCVADSKSLKIKQILEFQSKIFILTNLGVIISDVAEQKLIPVKEEHSVLILTQYAVGILQVSNNKLIISYIAEVIQPAFHMQQFCIDIEQLDYFQVINTVQFIDKKQNVWFLPLIQLNKLDVLVPIGINKALDKTFSFISNRLVFIKVTEFGLETVKSNHIVGAINQDIVKHLYPIEQPMDPIRLLQLPSAFVSNDEIDGTAQFETMLTFLKSSSNEFKIIPATLLSINQNLILEKATKFNKSDISPWLSEYYASLDSTKPLPKVKLQSIFDDLLLCLAPIYHIETLIFNAALQLYQSNKDPFEIAFYFVMCNKVSVLSQLFKTSKQEKIGEFLKKDFSQPASQQAAGKNAFILLSKNKYLLASTWFLIARQYKECFRTLCVYEKQFWLAIRCVQILFLQQQIDQQLYQNLVLYIMEVEFDELQKTDTVMSKTLHFLNYIWLIQFINGYNLYKGEGSDFSLSTAVQKFIEDVPALQFKDISEIQMLSSIFAQLHYFMQNTRISNMIISALVSIQIQESSRLLKVTYSRICKDLNMRPLVFFGFQNLQTKVTATNNNISIESILQSCVSKDSLIQSDQVYLSKFEQLPNISRVLSLLYVSSKEFQEAFDNSFFIEIGIQRELGVSVYHESEVLQIEFLDKLFVHCAVATIFSIVQADPSNNLNIIGRAFEYFNNMFNIHTDQKIVQFQDFYLYVKQKLFNDTEKQMINKLIKQADEHIFDVCLIYLEKNIFKFLTNMNQQSLQRVIQQFLDSFRKQQKQIVINQNQIVNFQRQEKKDSNQSLVYVVRTLPMICVIHQKGVGLHVLVVENGVTEVIQLIPCKEFFLLPSGILVGTEGGFVLYILQSKDLPLSQEQLQEQADTSFSHTMKTYQYVRVQSVDFSCASGTRLSQQQSRQKYILMNEMRISVKYFQLDVLRSKEYLLSEKLGLNELVINKVIQLVVLEENQIVVHCVVKNQPCLLVFTLIDLMFENKVVYELIPLQNEYLYMFLVPGKQLYLTLLGPKQMEVVRCVKQQNEYKFVVEKEHEFDQKFTKLFADIFYREFRNCCADYDIIVCNGDQYTSICPICGRQIVQQPEQELFHHGFKVVFK